MEAAQKDTSTAYSGKHSKAVQSLAMLQSLHPSTLEITSWDKAARSCSDIKSCRSSEVRSLEAPSAPFDKDTAPHSPKAALERTSTEKLSVGGYFPPYETCMEPHINHQIDQHGLKLDPKLPNMDPSCPTWAQVRPHSRKTALENNLNRKVFGWGHCFLHGVNHQIAQECSYCH